MKTIRFVGMLHHLAVTVCALILSIGAVGVVYGQSPSPLDAPGVDVLFLVDQSGSMGGLAAGSNLHPRANDTLGLRFEAPQNFVRTIAEDRLQVRPETVHRIAVVDFGDNALRRLEWTPIDWTGDASESWNKLNSELARLNSSGGGLNPGRYSNTNRGNTNFVAAFNEAATLMAQLPTSEVNRTRVIILLTDGYPCVWSVPANNCLDQNAHMNAVRGLVQDNLSDENFRLYVVAMNDADRDYWSEYGPRWTAIAGTGRARQVASNADVGLVFHDIWTELSELFPGAPGVVDSPIQPGPIVVPPYLDTISFTLFKKLPDDRLEIHDQADQLMTDDMPDVVANGENIYQLTVFRPQPGLWRVGTNGDPDDVDIQMRTVVASGKLISPPNQVAQALPTTIKWQLRDSRGELLPKYADQRYRLVPAVTVSAGGEVLSEVNLELEGESTYAATFTPFQAGLHTISMEAVAKDLDNKEIVVFSGEVSTFGVSEATLEVTNLTSPYPQFKPVTLNLELQDNGGRRVEVGESVTVSASVITSAQIYPINLVRKGDSSFSGTFMPLEPGDHRLVASASVIDAAGDVRELGDLDNTHFTVSRISLQPIANSVKPAQLTKQTLVYEFRYAVGRKVDSSPDLKIMATIQKGESILPLSLERQPNGRYQAVVLPGQAGLYQVRGNVVVTDATGENHTVDNVLDHQFEVSPVRLQATKDEKSISQYVPYFIDFRFVDAQDTPVVVDSTVEVEAVIQDGGSGRLLRLQSTEDGRYTARFVPVSIGERSVVATVRSGDSTLGDPYVESQSVQNLEVMPSVLQPVAMPDSLAIFGTHTLIFEYLSQGERVMVDESLKLRAQVRSDQGRWPFELRRIDSGLFQGEFVPLTIGNHQIAVSSSLIDESGNQYSLPEATVGRFVVQSPIFTLAEPTNEIAQYRLEQITYAVHDVQGQPLQLAAGYRMIFTGTIALNGAPVASLALTPDSETTYSASFTPDAPQAYELITAASIEGPDGSSYSIFRSDPVSIRVRPTKKLSVALAEPLAGNTQHQTVRAIALEWPTTWTPLSKPSPVVIEAQLVDSDGNLVDPSMALINGPVIPMRLSVVEAGSKQDFSSSFVLQPTGVPGIFRAEGNNLQRGLYNISLSMLPELDIQPVYIVNETTQVSAASIRLDENWWWVALLGGIGLFFVALVSGSVLVSIRNRRLQQHPCIGTLQIENDFGTPLRNITLGGLNRIQIKKLPVTTHIKMLEVRCNSDQESKQRVVHITARLDNGQQASGRLEPGKNKIPLGNYKVYIRKLN